ncbi:MAG: hypothetical protein O2816_05145, partial [Planctomycetota bacterium]|nr:hypothetical protein [Planctomycetota bacterium]
LRFAHALILAGGIFRDDRLFQDAGLQLAKVSQARPDDWRVLDEHAKTLVTRTMLCSRVEGPDPNWLVRATELATKAADLAPKEVAPRWRRFFAQYIALVQGGTTPEEGLFVSLAELADELTAFGRESGNADLELVGESYWFLCNLTPVTARFEGRELPAPAPSEEVSKRLTVFAERLHSIPEGPLRLDAVRTWYMLAVFLGDLERWEEDLGLAIEMGLPAEEARFLALMGMHKRGAAESAARIAAELALDSEGDMAWRALTVYRHKTGDAAGALAATRNVRSVDRSLRLARAILLLEVHDAEGAQALLVVLAGEVTGTPLAGPVAHAYGVALALGGDKVGAKLQLSVAARILGDEDGAGAKATLAEL